MPSVLVAAGACFESVTAQIVLDIPQGIVSFIEFAPDGALDGCS